MKATFYIVLLSVVFLTTCGTTPTITAAQVPQAVESASASETPDFLSVRSTERAGTIVAVRTEASTQVQVHTSGTTPTKTPTDSLTQIQWHPEKIIIDVSESANDGNPWMQTWPTLRLYWDGTMIQGMGSSVNVTHLNQSQICKLLISIDRTGWFEPNGRGYEPIFAGLGGTSIAINAWKSKMGGGQIFNSALSGEGVRTPLFCGDCITSSEHNMISSETANTYFILFNYLPTNFILYDEFKEPGEVPSDYQITCATQIQEFPFLPIDVNAKFPLFSESGRRAVAILNQNSSEVQTVLYKIDGNKQVFSYNLENLRTKALEVIPRLWSKDNQYVYLSLYPKDEVIEPFHEAIALQQIDTNTGISRILFAENGNFYAYRLSNTGSKLAYIKQDQNPGELVLISLPNGAESSLKISIPGVSLENYQKAGGIWFNWDASKLFFSAIYKQNDKFITTFFFVDLLNPVRATPFHTLEGEFKIRELYDDKLETCQIEKNLIEY
jgi:hypothetical protein